jgi:uncharacterized protein YjbJ (UPF0337 family)
LDKRIAMSRNTVSCKRKQARVDVNRRWVKLTYNDVTGIDGDIERLIELLQEKHGYTRDRASAELVRRLSLTTA